MTKTKRMPPLTIDEVILLIDAYFCLQKVENKQVKRELVENLSKCLRALPFYPELKIYDNFRSYDGMMMCLANVAYADPEAKSNFGHGSAKQRLVLSYYSHRKDELHAYAQAIKKLSSVDFPLCDEYFDFVAGALLPSYHIFTEKRNRIIMAVERETKNHRGTICRVCERDMNDIYEDASNLMEIHINLPLHQNTAKFSPSPADLVLLCASCHKLAHTAPEFFEVNNLKQRIRGLIQ